MDPHGLVLNAVGIAAKNEEKLVIDGTREVAPR
jgi:hypothetical protein